jgi:lysylphosphatidylglycerol synthetase-like protein (DUF2156 family)
LPTYIAEIIWIIFAHPIARHDYNIMIYNFISLAAFKKKFLEAMKSLVTWQPSYILFPKDILCQAIFSSYPCFAFKINN